MGLVKDNVQPTQIVTSLRISYGEHLRGVAYWYTPSQRGNNHHSMFHNPTAAVNLFHVGKQYLTLCKAEADVTRNLIGRKIISNVKHADARNSLPILDVIRSSHKHHSASEYCK